MLDNNLYNELCNDFLPVFKKILATKKYAITLGGSHGKGIADKNSDFDFRIYYEKCVDRDDFKHVFAEIQDLVQKWNNQGIKVDSLWPRSISEIDNKLDKWCSGQGSLIPYEWSIWGYNLLTDIYNQKIVDDPFLVAEGWKKKLSTYPIKLEKSIIQKHSSSLKYWRNDYHYINKVKRKDFVFLSSLTARLVNDIMQIIYALNHFYYPGDGMNLIYTKNFSKKPDNFEDRITISLYPKHCEDMLKNQYNDIISLINDTLKLIC